MIFLIKIKFYKHKGVYAFRKQALLDFYNTPMTPLEASEKIEAIPGIKDLITLVQLSTQAELKELLKALGPESPEAKIITSMRTQVAHLDRRFPEAAQLQI